MHNVAKSNVKLMSGRPPARRRPRSPWRPGCRPPGLWRRRSRPWTACGALPGCLLSPRPPPVRMCSPRPRCCQSRSRSAHHPSLNRRHASVARVSTPLTRTGLRAPVDRRASAEKKARSLLASTGTAARGGSSQGPYCAKGCMRCTANRGAQSRAPHLAARSLPPATATPLRPQQHSRPPGSRRGAASEQTAAWPAAKQSAHARRMFRRCRRRASRPAGAGRRVARPDQAA